MQIQVAWGEGYGPTEISAFDAALADAGLNNLNLIRLSSVIPPLSTVVIKKYEPLSDHFGKKAYVVLSYAISSKEKKNIYAGLGWLLSPQGGVFVEHVSYESEEHLLSLLQRSLRAMSASRPFLAGAEPAFKIIGVTSAHVHTCVLVAALYKLESWTDKKSSK